MKVLVCDNIEELGEDFVRWAEGVLPEWRKEQMLKIKHLRGKIQCAVAYLLVNQLVSCSVIQLQWRYNEHGKPYFEGRNDLFFSISHCRSAVAVAIDEEEVGIDIEEVSRYREQLVDYVANEEEKYEMDERCDDNRDKFMELWTMKEAVFKLYGTGITHEIKDVLKNYDGNLYVWKFGGKVMTVATRRNVKI